MKYIYMCLLMILIIGCRNSKDENPEKYQKSRDDITNIEDKIVDIKTDFIFGTPALYIIDDILIVLEIKPKYKGIHLFNKNTFEYLTSTGLIGRGPGEIASLGRLGIDQKNGVIWVQDHGKRVMWKFPLDSILNNEMYLPTQNIALHNELFLDRFCFVNDSIAIGKAVRVLSHNSFDMVMAKLNITRNVTEEYGYSHPKAVGKNSNSKFSLSLENSIYVNCYGFSDLMTICDLEGNLKYNVYGPGWIENAEDNKSYFYGVSFINNHIIASYLGDIGFTTDEYKRPKGIQPTKFLIFDLDGNYVKTIETGREIQFFCVDEEYNRVIVYFADGENPFGYFTLNLN